MPSDELVENVKGVIEKRDHIKSSEIYNAFRRNSNTEISDRTIGRVLKELDDNDVISRKREGNEYMCFWEGDSN